MKYDIKKMRNLYDQWQSSGLGKVAFCKQHGIRPNTFHYWIKKFRNGNSYEPPRTTGNKGFSQMPIAHPVGTGQAQKVMAVINFPSGISLELFYPVEASLPWSVSPQTILQLPKLNINIYIVYVFKGSYAMDQFSGARNSKMEIGEVYYWTSTVYKWKHLLKPEKYKQIITQSLLNLNTRGKVKIYGFIIMHNHIHLLWEMLEMNGKEMPHASFQKFTAQTIQKDLKGNHPNVLSLFRENEKERRYRYWQRDPLAVKVYSREMAEQKLEYMHLNPLQSHWSLVARPEDYHYSSASFYKNEVDNFGFLTHYMDSFRGISVVCEDTDHGRGIQTTRITSSGSRIIIRCKFSCQRPPQKQVNGRGD